MVTVREGYKLVLCGLLITAVGGKAVFVPQQRLESEFSAVSQVITEPLLSINNPINPSQVDYGHSVLWECKDLTYALSKLS